jgi:PKHD-type hydroxylase
VDRARRDCDYVPLPTHRYALFARFFATTLSATLDARLALSPSPMIYRYPAGVGMVAHHDLVTPIERQRCAASGEPVLGGDFTTVLFLNSLSASDGGALSFPGTDVRIAPRCGTLVVFRVDVIHEVERVVRGPRYTVVARAVVE